MTQIKGTNVLAPVVPFDTTDTHASHEARYGKGGYRSVADTTERDAIPQLRREAGMLVCVLADGKVWRLGDNLTTWTEFAVSSDWATLSGKPSTFTPSSHTHTASQITDFSTAVAAAAPPTTDASLLTSGTLSASRLPASVVLTTDGRLSDARTPTTHTHTAEQVSGLATVATSGSYADLTNKPTIPAATTSASDLTSGTLPDARLSSAIATYATLAATDNQPASGLDVYPRGEATSGASGGNSGQIWWIFFTPSVSFTASAITFCSGTIAGSGLTLARMGLYTFDETTVTLVARTASDTTLFNAINTAYTRSFATAGGYPATYDLVAGTRYGAAVIAVGTTAPNFSGRTIQAAVGGQTPRMAASLSGQTDLVTSGTVNNAQANLYARLT
jgi:hypothetical protein